MKKHEIKVEAVSNKYALYINGNYAGLYNRTIINIKMRAWNLP